MLYLDSSAIVKLIVREPGSSLLVEAVSADPDVVSSALAYPEVMRAIRRVGGPVRRAERVLRSIAFVPVDQAILREAARIEPKSLRTLDAIHLASVLSLRVVLRDVFGRTQEQTTPFYLVGGLLERGLSEYAYNLGFRRPDLQSSFGYSSLAFVGCEPPGSDGLTLELQSDQAIPSSVSECHWLRCGGARRLRVFAGPA